MKRSEVLPPVICTEDDLAYFLSAMDDTLAEFYGRNGPVVSLGRGLFENIADKARQILPAGVVPPLVNPDLAGQAEKKTPLPDLS